MKRLNRNSILLLLTLPALLLGGCSGNKSTNNGQFLIAATAPTDAVQEGDPTGITLPVTITRMNDHSAPLTLRVETSDQLLLASFDTNELTPDNDNTTLNVSLAIADLPIQAHTKSIDVIATDGTVSTKITIAIPTEPTNAPDIYLLAGQSNMIGFSGDGTKQSFAGGEDEPNPRIKQLNTSKNDQFTIFTTREDFTSESKNAIAPVIVQAEDPLHIPLDASNTSSKNLSYIGLGLSFAKAALPNTTADIVLVPAAWSGSAFCDNTDGPIGQWNAQSTADSNLGNDWMFERAVTRTNMTINETGGVLRGILWHQGESDANERCADSYAANMVSLAQEFRLRITPDARGADLRRSDANIPFIVGSMSKGVDERNDLSVFSEEKLIIDSVHRNIALQVSHAAFSNHDDLVPANGYPCGNTTCIHFGPQALREMGSRYYQALLSAVSN
ncbi:MAG: sialate O-acetylesterase [Granulosicoccaceae bacterium]